MEYGAVPDAVSTTPINEKILCAHFLVWPPEPEPEPEAEAEAEAEAGELNLQPQHTKHVYLCARHGQTVVPLAISDVSSCGRRWPQRGAPGQDGDDAAAAALQLEEGEDLVSGQGEADVVRPRDGEGLARNRRGGEGLCQLVCMHSLVNGFFLHASHDCT